MSLPISPSLSLSESLDFSQERDLTFVYNKNVYQWDWYRPLQWPPLDAITGEGGWADPSSDADPPHPHPPSWTDRRFWKHYLPLRSVKKFKICFLYNYFTFVILAVCWTRPKIWFTSSSRCYKAETWSENKNPESGSERFSTRKQVSSKSVQAK